MLNSCSREKGCNKDSISFKLWSKANCWLILTVRIYCYRSRGLAPVAALEPGSAATWHDCCLPVAVGGPRRGPESAGIAQDSRTSGQSHALFHQRLRTNTRRSVESESASHPFIETELKSATSSSNVRFAWKPDEWILRSTMNEIAPPSALSSG